MQTSELIVSVPPDAPSIENNFRTEAHVEGGSETDRPIASNQISSTNILVRQHLSRLRVESDFANFEKFIVESVSRMTLKRDEIWMQKLMDDELLYIIQNSPIKPILQVGPSCGIAALCMALNTLIESDNSVLPEFEQILKMAKSQGFTNHGEMFSAQALLDFALRLSTKISGYVASNDVLPEEKRKLLLQHLVQKHVLLVPYDKGPNNEPDLKNGLKAHWVVLTGLLIVAKRFSSNLEKVLDKKQNEERYFRFKESVNIDQVLHCLEECHLMKFDVAEDHEIFVCARQGKSLRLHLWHLDELMKSNNQLFKDPHEDFYLLPDGGVYEGLCGKIVILKRT